MPLGDRNVRLCAIRLSVCLAAAAAISLAGTLSPCARAQAQSPSPAESRTELHAQEQAPRTAVSSQEAADARSAGAGAGVGVGDISMRDGQPYVHLHGVVAFSDGSTRGGHVIEARVAPVAEIAVVALAVGGGGTSAD